MEPAVLTSKTWTEADLQALQEDGYIHELVDDELVMSPKNDFFHGSIPSQLSMALRAFVKGNRLGDVLDSSTGFWMKNRNCRAPDISFVSRARLKALGFKRSTRQFFPGAPDLAVEVLSLNNARHEINERLKDFFESGTRLAWLVDPSKQQVEVCRSSIQRRLLGIGGFLEWEDLLPGFRFAITELFEEDDWQ